MVAKAQSSVEIMVAVTLLLFIAIIAQVFIFDKTVLSWQLRSHATCLDIVNTVSNGLNFAAYSDGSSTRFSIPQDVSGTQYTLTVYGDYVAVDYSDDSCLRRFTAASVTYGLASPPFNLTGGEYRVNNTDGALTLEKLS